MADQPSSISELPSPPKPRMAFRVGVVGHRRDRLTFLCGFLPAVRKISDDAADLLLREVLDWRVLFRDRPPEVGP